MVPVRHMLHVNFSAQGGEAAMDLRVRLEAILPALTKCEAKVARICMVDPTEFTTLTVKEISKMAHVSPPTVLRFCRSLGYEGFADLRDRMEGGT